MTFDPGLTGPSLRTADVFPVVASLPQKRRPEIRLRFARCTGTIHSYPFLFENEDFSSGLVYRPHVSGKNGYRKRIFSKTISRVEIFENAGFLFRRERTKREIFEYDDVIHHIVRELRMLRRVCYRISIVLALSRFETIRIHYVRARIFFEDGGENRRLQKYPVTCGRGHRLAY